jgi:putative inorganic carbon (hco3(-)) transporter
MFFFMLLYLFFVLVRPQDYPEWENTGIPVLPIVLVSAFLFWLLSRNKDLSAPQYVLLPAFLLVLMASQIVNGWAGGALVQLSTFGPAVMAFLVLSHAVTDRKRVLTTMAVIVVCSSLLSIHGIEQVETGVGWSGVGLSQETRIQYVGIFNDPNDLGLLFIMALPMAMFLASRGGMLGLRRLFWWTGSGLLLYGIFLTSSRGALLALIAVLGVWVWRRRGLFMAGILGVGALGGIMMLPSRMGDIDAGEESAAGRVDAWYSGFEMFTAHPLFGIGPGNFADNNFNLTAHNSFVLVLAETGFFGYAIWLAFVCYGFMMTSAVLRHRPVLEGEAEIAEWNTERSFALTLLLAQAGFYTATFFLSRSYVILLYLLAALVLGYYTGARQRYPELPRFELSRDLIRWPLLAIASIVGLYLLVKILLVTS